MKTIFLLFVVFTDSQGYESLHVVSNKQHKDRISCIAEKAQHKTSDNVSFFCGESHLFFNKEQKLY